MVVRANAAVHWLARYSASRALRARCPDFPARVMISPAPPLLTGGSPFAGGVMRPRIALGILTFCVSCGPVQGPNDVHHVEGQFCEPGTPDEAVLEAEAWRVTIFYNDSQVRDVVED